MMEIVPQDLYRHRLTPAPKRMRSRSTWKIVERPEREAADAEYGCKDGMKETRCGRAMRSRASGYGRSRNGGKRSV